MKKQKHNHGSSTLLQKQSPQPIRRRKRPTKGSVTPSNDTTNLVNGNAPLQRAISRQRARGEFEEACGALFMPLARGGYSETPYCANCFRPMWCFHDAFPYECTNRSCGQKAEFTGKQLREVLNILND